MLAGGEEKAFGNGAVGYRILIATNKVGKVLDQNLFYELTILGHECWPPSIKSHCLAVFFYQLSEAFSETTNSHTTVY